MSEGSQLKYDGSSKHHRSTMSPLLALDGWGNRPLEGYYSCLDPKPESPFPAPFQPVCYAPQSRSSLRLPNPPISGTPFGRA